MGYGFKFKGVQLLSYKFQPRRNSYTTNGICQLCDPNVPLVLTLIAGAGFMTSIILSFLSPHPSLE